MRLWISALTILWYNNLRAESRRFNNQIRIKNKANDGALYFISVDTAVDLGFIDYTQPGHSLLVAYKSTDNGKTWKKLGSLPDSWSIQGPVIETADGALYIASFSVCNEADSIYNTPTLFCKTAEQSHFKF